MNEEQKNLTAVLIKEFSRNRNTSFLVSFVADNNGMLGACRALIEKYDAGDQNLEQWLSSICHDTGLSAHTVLKDIQNIVELFTPNQSMQDQFAVLGLSAGASQEEIKRAYRKLSLAHHPDTADQSKHNNPERFIQITRAYHALIDSLNNGARRIPGRAAPVWQQGKKRVVTIKQRKKVYYLATGLLVMLLVISILSAINYRKKTMIAGLQHSRGAFIPPAAKRKVSLSAPYRSDDRGSNSYLIYDTENTESGSESSSRKPDYGIAANGNALVLDQKEEEQQVTGIPRKLGDVANTSQSEDTDIMIGQDIVTLTRDLNMKRVAADFKQDVNQPVTEVPQFESASKSIGELGDRTYGTQGVSQGKSLVVDIHVQSRQSIKENEAPKIQHFDTDEIVINAQSAGVDAQEASNIASSSHIDANAVSSQEKLVSETTAVKENNVQSSDTYNASVTIASPSENLTHQENLQQRIEQFFSGYIEAYNQRNLIVFTSYFYDDAVENGQPFEKMQSIYEELFAKTSAVTLQINDREIRQETDNVTVEGTFEVILNYKNNRIISGAGPIVFEFIEEKDSYKIKTLTYEFKK